MLRCKINVWTGRSELHGLLVIIIVIFLVVIVISREFFILIRITDRMRDVVAGRTSPGASRKQSAPASQGERVEVECEFVHSGGMRSTCPG